jgi:nitrogen fixation protein NifU and related proteins
MALYSDKVMDHFMNPRNVGDIPGADGVGEVGNPVCGDMMTFYIKVKNDRLEDVKFKTFGCGAAIAVSSMVSEMAKGKTLDEAMKITNESVAEELGGLPKNKMHCSNLGADALHAAIENYRAKATAGAPAAAKAHVHEAESKTCPFCDTELKEEGAPICQSCQIEFEDCPGCGKLVSSGDARCPHCGAELKK